MSITKELTFLDDGGEQSTNSDQSAEESMEEVVEEGGSSDERLSNDAIVEGTGLLPTLPGLTEAINLAESLIDEPNPLIEVDLTNYEDLILRAIAHDLPDLDLPPEAQAIVDNLVDEIREAIEVKIETDETLLNEYGIDSNALINLILDELAIELASNALPDELQLVVDLARFYNSVDHVQDLFSEFYAPGDTVAQTITKYIESMRSQYLPDVGKPAQSAFAKWYTKNVIDNSRWLFGDKLMDSLSQTVSILDQFIADNGVGLDYNTLFDMQLYATLGIITSFSQTIDMGWSEFGQLLARNMLEVPSSDDDIIESLMFTLGALAFKEVNLSKYDFNAYIKTLESLTTLMSAKLLQNAAFMTSDYTSKALSYLTIGLLGGILGAKSGSIEEVGNLLKTKLGITSLAIPVGMSGTYAVFVPGRVGPDVVIVTKAQINNINKAVNIATKAFPAIKNYASLFKGVMITTGITKLDVGDESYTDLAASILNPVLNTVLDPIINNLINKAAANTDAINRKATIDALRDSMGDVKFNDLLDRLASMDFDLNMPMPDLLPATPPLVPETPIDDVVDNLVDEFNNVFEDDDTLTERDPEADKVMPPRKGSNPQLLGDDSLSDHGVTVTGSKGLKKKTY